MGKIVEFDYMCKDTVIAHVVLDTGAKTVTCEEYTTDMDYMLFGKLEHTVANLMRVLELRCFDRNRPDAKEILEYFGVPEYSPYHICLKTHGASTQDYKWIRWAGETLTWDDVKLRN